MWNKLVNHETWRGRFINKKKDGSLYTEEAVISPVFDTRGDIINYVAVKRDITEELKLQEQLNQAQKMESVGRLAGGVAHDFNNMLGVITGHAELAMEMLEPNQPVYDDLQEILKAAKRSVDLTRQLLAFARQQTVSPKVLNLNETVEGMLKMLKRLIGEDIDLKWKPDNDLWKVKVDPVQIDQILANLCVNARDAIADVGMVVIETGNTVFDKNYCEEHIGSEPGNYVMIAVSDTGCGMDKNTIKNIFEPFYTTKELGEGTGLGLSMVYGAVKQNKGFINVYSEPDKGTTIKIYLPQHTTNKKTMESKEGVGEIVGGKGNILFVEDEPKYLEIGKMLLQKLGYRVLAAGTTDEAVNLARKHAGEIDLLITDVIMPKMNGRDLVKKVLTIDPNMKYIYMSGYTANFISHHGVLEEGINFIQKPFSLSDLAAKVREVLAES